MSAIPLQNARVCLDCGTVIDQNVCVCSSQAQMTLAAWLDRAEEGPHVHRFDSAAGMGIGRGLLALKCTHCAEIALFDFVTKAG